MTEDTSPENLRKFLESDDPALVRMGVSMAKGTGVNLTIEDLDHLLNSKDIELVKSGITIADEAGIASKDAVMKRLYGPLLDGDREVRRASADMLGRLGDPGAVDPLIAAIESHKALEDGWEGEYEDIESLITALVGIGEPALDELYKLSNSAYDEASWDNISEYVAEVSMRALADIGGQRAVDYLSQMLLICWGDSDSTPNWNASCNAVDCLEQAGGARAVEPVSECYASFLLGTIDNLSRQQLYDKHHSCGCGDLIGSYQAVIESNNAQRQLIESIWEAMRGEHWCDAPMSLNESTRETIKHYEPYALEVISEKLIGEDPSYAAELLDFMGWEPTLPEDTDLRIRYLLALKDTYQIANLGELAVEPLIKVLEDDYSDLHSVAAEALGEMGTPGAIEQLVKVLDTSLERFRNIRRWPLLVLNILDNIEDYSLLAPFAEKLTDLLSANDTKTRQMAARILEKMGWEPDTDEIRIIYLLIKEDAASLVKLGGIVVEPLIKELENPESRSLAIKVLSDIGDERAVESLRKIVEEAKQISREVVMARSNAISRLDISAPERKKLEKLALLFPTEKVMNLEQEEFAEIVNEQSKSLETIEITPEDIVGLLSESSAQARWIVACGVVEISCYDGATIDKIFENPINLFWSEMLTYPNLITKKDRDEIRRVLKRLPPVLICQIGKGLMGSATIVKSKEASTEVKKNCKMVTTIYHDTELMKVMFGGM